jgi:glycyl-tRNA synthetase beta chain
MEAVKDDVAFIQTATRPLNIVAAARKKNIAFPHIEAACDISHRGLESEEGSVLASMLGQVEEAVNASVQDGDAKSIAAALQDLGDPINRFFDGAMVMVDDERVRNARLGLLDVACRLLLCAGDFTKIVIEGS